jgi:hypothetical protein
MGQPKAMAKKMSVFLWKMSEAFISNTIKSTGFSVSINFLINICHRVQLFPAGCRIWFSLHVMRCELVF